MIDSIVELENSLKAQLSSLATDIRNAENALITTKEGYLKVQGAIEILDILKKKVEDDQNKATLALATD
jgi:septal ring factor EnvC (AmiA/AmiB activator)